MSCGHLNLKPSSFTFKRDNQLVDIKIRMAKATTTPKTPNVNCTASSNCNIVELGSCNTNNIQALQGINATWYLVDLSCPCALTGNLPHCPNCTPSWHLQVLFQFQEDKCL